MSEGSNSHSKGEEERSDRYQISPKFTGASLFELQTLRMLLSGSVSALQAHWEQACL